MSSIIAALSDASLWIKIGAGLGGLVAFEKILEQVFPNASILKKIGSGLGWIYGLLPKSS